ncbi:MAG: ABC transporter permease [Atopobiaceae bacterium]|nr:ABC transporter permease [Atopobiaceae bacterium]
MKAVTSFLRKPIASAIVAIAIGFAVAAVVLAAAGYDPAASFAALFSGALGKPKYIANVFIKATPILLTGVAVAFAFQTGLFNIGAEGQYILGTILSSIVGIMVDLPPIIEIPLVVLSGVLGGALLGAFIGFLKAKFGIHEVITSIMTNWIMLYLCNFVVGSNTFHKPNSTSALPINPSAYTMILPNWKKSPEGMAALDNIPWLKEVLLKTDLNMGFIVAAIVAVLAGILLARTKLGFKLRAVGHNKDAAHFSGINVDRSIITCMLISGAICGLAGALNITGISPHTITLLAAQEGYGFNGLSVAFIAGCSTVGCIPSSLLFAGLLYGGMTVQQVMGAPSDIINIMIGTIVFFTALPGITPILANWIDKRRASKADALLAAEAASATGDTPREQAAEDLVTDASNNVEQEA